MVPVLIHAILMVEFVHLVDIDEDEDDEAKNGTLLRHPEPEFKSEETDIVQDIDKQDRHAKRNQKPYR